MENLADLTGDMAQVNLEKLPKDLFHEGKSSGISFCSKGQFCTEINAESPGTSIYANKTADSCSQWPRYEYLKNYLYHRYRYR